MKEFQSERENYDKTSFQIKKMQIMSKTFREKESFHMSCDKLLYSQNRLNCAGFYVSHNERQPKIEANRERKRDCVQKERE